MFVARCLECVAWVKVYICRLKKQAHSFHASNAFEFVQFGSRAFCRHRADHPDFVGNQLADSTARLMPAASIQCFFSGMGARSSSSLERNSLRIGEVFAVL